MTIRKKLVISNILMIVIPATLALIFIAIGIKTVGDRYWNSMAEMYEDENGIYSAQSLIYAYKDELSKREWLEYKEVEHDEKKEQNADYSERTKKMVTLENELTQMGYHFRIKVGDEILFSNLIEKDQNKIDEFLKDSYDEVQSLALAEKDSSIIKSTFKQDDEDYGKRCEIVAVCLNSKLEHVNKESFFHKYIVTFIIAFLIFIIFAVVITNMILSQLITRMVLKPLEALRGGTKEIREGNLDSSIPYKKKDEFGEVCDDFDEMRQYLKESVDTTLAYEEYRKALIAGISHDLRTPLTSIKGYVEGLKDGIANTPEKQARYYDAIQIRAKDMEALVDSLSIFTKLDTKQFHYDFEKTDMDVYVKELVEDYKEEASNKNIHITVDSRLTNSWVQIDSQEMHRVFINLFENSAKYCTKGNSEIQIRMREAKGQLDIQIQDDGPGVPDNELTRIFQSFYRGDESRTTPGEGSGLGLAIVKQIVEGHKGTICAKNREGLVMMITLPLCEEEVADEKNIDY